MKNRKELRQKIDKLVSLHMCYVDMIKEVNDVCIYDQKVISTFVLGDIEVKEIDDFAAACGAKVYRERIEFGDFKYMYYFKYRGLKFFQCSKRQLFFDYLDEIFGGKNNG